MTATFFNEGLFFRSKRVGIAVINGGKGGRNHQQTRQLCFAGIHKFFPDGEYSVPPQISFRLFFDATLGAFEGRCVCHSATPARKEVETLK
jgi:hypothetical protein